MIASGDVLATGQLAALDLGTGEVTRLDLAGVSPRYVPTGHLVYAALDGSVRGGCLRHSLLIRRPICVGAATRALAARLR